jgi:hypothetical protein
MPPFFTNLIRDFVFFGEGCEDYAHDSLLLHESSQTCHTAKRIPLPAPVINSLELHLMWLERRKIAGAIVKLFGESLVFVCIILFFMLPVLSSVLRHSLIALWIRKLNLIATIFKFRTLNSPLRDVP